MLILVLKPENRGWAELPYSNRPTSRSDQSTSRAADQIRAPAEQSTPPPWRQQSRAGVRVAEQGQAPTEQPPFPVRAAEQGRTQTARRRQGQAGMKRGGCTVHGRAAGDERRARTGDDERGAQTGGRQPATGGWPRRAARRRGQTARRAANEDAATGGDQKCRDERQGTTDSNVQIRAGGQQTSHQTTRRPPAKMNSGSRVG